jgi:hypothetical protein
MSRFVVFVDNGAALCSITYQVNIHTDTLNESGFVEGKSHGQVTFPLPIPLQQQSPRLENVPSIHTIPKEQVNDYDFLPFQRLTIFKAVGMPQTSSQSVALIMSYLLLQTRRDPTRTTRLMNT